MRRTKTKSNSESNSESKPGNARAVNPLANVRLTWWRESLRVVDRTLHHESRIVQPLRSAIIMVVVFGGVYGFAMGSFAWVIGGYSLAQGIQQMCYSSSKVPMLLFATFALSLPSFYVLNSLLGLRADFGIAVRNILLSQATLAISLCSLAPLVLLWYASVPGTRQSYASSVLLNTLFFAIASFTSQATLRKHYRPLIERDRAHRWMLWTWLIVFAVVGIQMGWVLRPFIGNPNQPPTFLRPHAWDNAYLNVLRIVRGLF